MHTLLTQSYASKISHFYFLSLEGLLQILAWNFCLKIPDTAINMKFGNLSATHLILTNLWFVQTWNPQKANIQSIKWCCWNLFPDVGCAGKEIPTPDMKCWFRPQGERKKTQVFHSQCVTANTSLSKQCKGTSDVTVTCVIFTDSETKITASHSHLTRHFHFGNQDFSFFFPRLL